MVRLDIFILFLEEMFQLFTFKNDAICGFVMYGLYYVKVSSLSANFLERCFFFFL